jgi:mannosyltransferase OCH1-like enzyme
MIPKTVFQIFIGFDDRKHYLLRDNIHRFFHENTFYEHVFVTNEEQMVAFIEEKGNGSCMDCYNKLEAIESKVEFFKYLVLYEYGGIYLDTSKITNTKFKLDDFISEGDSAILSASEKKGMYCNDIMMFEAKHPILERVLGLILKYVNENTFNGEFEETVGRKLFSKAIRIGHFIEYNGNMDLSRIKKDDDLHFSSPRMKYRIYGLEFNGIFT